MAAEALRVEGLTAGYGATIVVEEVSLSVPAGGRVAVLGRNGVGKTTFLAAVMGLVARHAGAIRLGGADVAGLPPAARARRGLGYVPQSRDIFPSLTVRENLVAGLKARPASALEEAYRLFPRLEERRSHLGLQLSGGEQQMLSIARAILGRPSVLLLDEPLEGLAPIVCDQVMAALDGLAASRAMTILLIEQQIDRALAFADEAVILERGRIVWSGDAAALRGDSATLATRLGVGTARPRSPGTGSEETGGQAPAAGGGGRA